MSPDEEDEARPVIQPNTVRGTLIVALVLCLVCSLLVSAAAVLLRPTISRNRDLKRQRNVLIAAGLYDETKHTDADVAAMFDQIETVFINLPRRFDLEEVEAGEGDAGYISGDVDPNDYDPRKAAKDPDLQVRIPAEEDSAGIHTREPVSPVYLIRGEDGAISQIVLPIYGKGLWSTLYGFLALDADVSAGLPVRGITFYEHAETPGLGGEVDNPKWKAQWVGKQLFDSRGRPVLDVTKPGYARAENEIDGLSGATITANGVERLVNYWLGPDAFGPFLDRFRSGEFESRRSEVGDQRSGGQELEVGDQGSGVRGQESGLRNWERTDSRK